MNDDVRNQLERACEGLYYISERDAPFTVVDVMTDKDEATETRSFDAFFPPMNAFHPGYQEPQIERAKKIPRAEKSARGIFYTTSRSTSLVRSDERSTSSAEMTKANS
ncbi:MAG TPA: hypothetical protein VL501_06170 [Pyrinomonadaceae bacterium]|nr:hypothetical protein [Pyrinomonadaceae bacterium]